MTQFDTYAAHVRDLDPGMFLGQLVWYTVKENVQIPHADLLRALTLVGLEAHMPSVPSDVDVFRRKATNGARRQVPTATAGVFNNYLVRPVGNKDTATITRHVVREQVDANNVRLGYDTVAWITFTKVGSVVSSGLSDSAIGAPDHDTVDDIVNSVLDAYRTERGCLDGFAVRDLIRRVLVAHKATNVRYPAGGIYFLSLEHAVAVAGLEAVAADVEGMQVHSLNLLDDGKQRTMLRKAFEDESVGRAQELITEIQALIKSGAPISKAKFASYKAALSQLNDRMTEYGGLLEVNLSTTKSSLLILQRGVMGLLKQVKAK
jgi:hypothetical protein